MEASPAAPFTHASHYNIYTDTKQIVQCSVVYFNIVFMVSEHRHHITLLMRVQSETLDCCGFSNEYCG